MGILRRYTSCACLSAKTISPFCHFAESVGSFALLISLANYAGQGLSTAINGDVRVRAEMSPANQAPSHTRLIAAVIRQHGSCRFALLKTVFALTL